MRYVDVYIQHIQKNKPERKKEVWSPKKAQPEVDHKYTSSASLVRLRVRYRFGGRRRRQC